MLKQFPTMEKEQLIFIHSAMVSSLSHADGARPDVISPRKANKRAAGLSLPLQTLHTHPWHNQGPHTPPIYAPPRSPLDNCSDSKGLKMTLFSLSFFFTLLLTSRFFPCRMKGLPDTHSMHIPFRPGHTGSLCAAQRRGRGGCRRGKW